MAVKTWVKRTLPFVEFNQPIDVILSIVIILVSFSLGVFGFSSCKSFYIYNCFFSFCKEKFMFTKDKNNL